MDGPVGGTIVERLQSQRVLLVDVLHQIEAAIKTFGGTITATNGNGNGVTPKANNRGTWWAKASPAKRARITRKRLATIRANQSIPSGTAPVL